MFQISLSTEQQLLNINQNKKSVIYGILNKVNNKIYVGKSIRVNARFKSHFNSFKRKEKINEHLMRAFEKHGTENFEFIILEIIGADKINVRERHWIKHYKSFNKNFGYNKTMGGDGGNLTTETKLKLSETSPNKKKVYQFSKFGNFIKTWDSVHDIQRNLGYRCGTISKACNNTYINNKTAYGFFWSYDNNIANKLKNGCGHVKIKVNQKDLNNKLMNTWDSISEAAIETKSAKASIIRCCKHKQKTCNNFLFEYSTQ